MDRGDRSHPQPVGGREGEADDRERIADQRERHADIREATLDRWEHELRTRAIELRVVDDDAEAQLQLAREQRVQERVARRRAANERDDAVVERAVQRAASTPRAPYCEIAIGDAALARALDGLGALTDPNQSLPDTLRDLLVIAVDAIPAAAAATISLTVDGVLQPAASTADWADELHAAQLRHPGSPIADALQSRTVVSTDDLAGDPRWLLATAIGSDVHRSVCSVPLSAGATPLGVLTVYAEPAVRFDAHAALTVALLGAQASLAVGRHADRIEHQAALAAWERALKSRDQIGQAKGILMEQRGLTAAAAFELLRTTSQHLNTKVSAIADHVTSHRRLPNSPSDSP